MAEGNQAQYLERLLENLCKPEWALGEVSKWM